MTVETRNSQVAARIAERKQNAMNRWDIAKPAIELSLERNPQINGIDQITGVENLESLLDRVRKQSSQTRYEMTNVSDISAPQGLPSKSFAKQGLRQLFSA